MSAVEPAKPLEVGLPELGRCRNCDAELFGRYCVNCSQAAEVHVPTTRELLHELFEGLTHSDSRLWRTLKCLWFKPGGLTLEFVAGRRMAYLPPFRLYLILSVVFFLLASVSHTTVQAIQFDDAGSVSTNRITRCDDVNFVTFDSHPEWNQRAKHACEAIVKDNGTSLVHVAVATMPKAMFVFLPLVAFFHMLMYWWPRHRYAEHLLFFVHLHACFFSAITLALLVRDALALLARNAGETWPAVHGPAGVVVTVLLWYLVIYTVLAMKRVFRRSWAGTLLKAFALFLVYQVVLGLTVAIVFIYAMLQL